MPMRCGPLSHSGAGTKEKPPTGEAVGGEGNTGTNHKRPGAQLRRGEKEPPPGPCCWPSSAVASGLIYPPMKAGAATAGPMDCRGPRAGPWEGRGDADASGLGAGIAGSVPASTGRREGAGWAGAGHVGKVPPPARAVHAPAGRAGCPVARSVGGGGWVGRVDAWRPAERRRGGPLARRRGVHRWGRGVAGEAICKRCKCKRCHLPRLGNTHGAERRKGMSDGGRPGTTGKMGGGGCGAA